MPTPTSFQERLRPSEVVLRYLETAAFSEPGERQMRLPAIRDLAKKLNVGVSTVAQIYKNLSDKGRIRTEVGNGSFLLPASRAPHPKDNLKIGIGLFREYLLDPEGWYARIYGGLTLATMNTHSNATFIPLDLHLPKESLQKQVRELQAVLVMPGHLLSHLLVEMANKFHIPVLYLNPPKLGETRNFISVDFAGASEQLGTAFLASKRKRILFMISDPWHQSVSANYRLGGLMTGLQWNSSCGVQVEIEVADNYRLEDGKKALRRVLNKTKFRPDAIYAAGDFMALGCIEELESRGLSVPHEVSVVGGSGLSLEGHLHAGLTCSAQPYGKMGAVILEMIQEMTEKQQLHITGRTIPMGWIGGETTLDAENKILGCSFKKKQKDV
ncbi:MAG: substrate-binding domain-containing protein [Verrucomicrobiota bacterium]